MRIPYLPKKKKKKAENLRKCQNIHAIYVQYEHTFLHKVFSKQVMTIYMVCV